MTLLAIDPGRSYKGEKTIGYAVFDFLGEELERGQLTYEELMGELEPSYFLVFSGYRIEKVVVEDYVNNAKSKGGQRNGTSECIGMIEFACFQSEATKFIRQAPAALGPAKLHAPEGSYRKLQHLRHEDSAFLHGYEYLVKMGVIRVDLSATLEP